MSISWEIQDLAAEFILDGPLSDRGEEEISPAPYPTEKPGPPSSKEAQGENSDAFAAIREAARFLWM